MIITIIRKPLIGSVCENITLHNTGALNIDPCRILFDGSENKNNWHNNRSKTTYEMDKNLYDLGLKDYSSQQNKEGRWPANLLLTPSSQKTMDAQSGVSVSFGGKSAGGYGDSGGASRYFKKVGE